MPAIGNAQVEEAYGENIPFASQQNVAPTASTVADPLNIDSAASTPQDDPVDLLAERVEYDEANGIVTAIGKVEMVQAGRILRAEKVSYNLNEDKVEAEGNVVLNEVTGETYFADKVQLRDQMKDGFIRGLKGVLADGGRFSAEEGEKIGDLKVVMNKATYTSCEPCKANPSSNPLWQIKARQVTHNKEDQWVTYDDATFEVAGVPVFYTPYLSHSDGTVERKSGLLMPSVGFDSDLGGIYDQSYYWNIAPDKDATIGVAAFTDVAPLVKGEYRQRYKNAEISLQGGLTYSDRVDLDDGAEVTQDNQSRGHIFANARWDINDKWRAGTDLEVVSDSQYLRQYNISSETILENKAYVERFDDRDYAQAQLIRFKDIRVSDRKIDQPSVLPEIYSRWLGKPNDILGGRWSFETSALGLHREGDEQDIGRGSIKTGWAKKHITDIGLVNKLDLNVRGAVYKINDRTDAETDPTINSNGSAIRGFASANIETSYPLEKRFENSSVVVEPLVALTVGTTSNDNDDIPNEDSQDVFLDSTNLFNANRFPGYDRIEDRSHTTYGVRTGYYGDNGNQGEIFLGQSYRFEEDGNPFPEGSGLSSQDSDYVGNVSARLGSALQLNYALQLDNDDFSSQRHEVDFSTQIGRVGLGSRYFYANALQGTDFDTSREQIGSNLRYKITDEWSAFGGMQYDLAEETAGLRLVSYGLDYQGQCATFLISGERRLTSDSSGDSGNQIMMRLGLKNLGEFETSGFSVGSE